MKRTDRQIAWAMLDHHEFMAVAWALMGRTLLIGPMLFLMPGVVVAFAAMALWGAHVGLVSIALVALSLAGSAWGFHTVDRQVIDRARRWGRI